MVCLSAFLTTKSLGFFLDFDSNSNTPKEWKDLAHSPLGILPKNAIEVMQAVFWSPCGYEEIKLTKKPFTLRGLLFQMQNISFRRLGVRRKGFKCLFLFFRCAFTRLHFRGKIVGFSRSKEVLVGSEQDFHRNFRLIST